MKNNQFFLMQFGDTPQLRVLDFLIDNHFFDYPVTDFVKNLIKLDWMLTKSNILTEKPKSVLKVKSTC